MGVRHLDTNGTLTRDWSNDTDTERREAHCDIILKVTYLRDSDTGSRGNLIQGDCRTHSRLYRTYLYTEILENLNNPVRILRLLIAVNSLSRLLILIKQIQCGRFVIAELILRVYRTQHITAGILITLGLLDLHREFLIRSPDCLGLNPSRQLVKPCGKLILVHLSRLIRQFYNHARVGNLLL